MEGQPMNKLQQGGTVKNYLSKRDSNQASSTRVNIPIKQTAQESSDSANSRARAAYEDKVKKRIEIDRLKRKGQTPLGNTIADMGTNMLTLTTGFRTPDAEELEQGRSGWSGRADLIGNSVTRHLSNELTGGAMGWIGNKIASGEASSLVKGGIDKLSNKLSKPKPPVDDRIIHNLDDVMDIELGYKPTVAEKLKLAGKKVSEGASTVMNKKFIPTNKTKQVLPSKLTFKSAGNESAYGVSAVDEKGQSWGDLTMSESNGWGKPTNITVDPALRGRKMQDVLYTIGVKDSQDRGLAGLRSGDHLISAGKTMKAWDRMNTEVLGETSSLVNKKITPHDVVGITGHKDPNVVTNWLSDYAKVKKTQRVKVSINDVLGRKGPQKMSQGMDGWGTGNWNQAKDPVTNGADNWLTPQAPPVRESVESMRARYNSGNWESQLYEPKIVGKINDAIEGAPGKIVNAFNKNIKQPFIDKVYNPIKYRENIKYIKGRFPELLAESRLPEAASRMEKLGIDPTQYAQKQPTLTTNVSPSMYQPWMDSFNINPAKIDRAGIDRVIDHELGHRYQAFHTSSDFAKKYGVTKELKNSKIDDLASTLKTKPVDKLTYDARVDLKHFDGSGGHGAERLPFLVETRRDMINSGYLNDRFAPIDNGLLRKYLNENPTHRLSSIVESGSNSSITKLKNLMNRLPAVAPLAIGGTAYIQNKKANPE